MARAGRLSFVRYRSCGKTSAGKARSFELEKESRRIYATASVGGDLLERVRTVPVLGYVIRMFPQVSETFIANEILSLERLGIPLKVYSYRKPSEEVLHECVRQIKTPIIYLPAPARFCHLWCQRTSQRPTRSPRATAPPSATFCAPLSTNGQLSHGSAFYKLATCRSSSGKTESIVCTRILRTALPTSLCWRQCSRAFRSASLHMRATSTTMRVRSCCARR